MMMDFIKYAAMAPSTRNTRPWILGFAENQLRVMPDLSRWLPVDDPDKKQLYISLGCAVENLSIAASTLQFDTRVDIRLDDNNPQVILDLIRNSKMEKSPLFDALEQRRTHRGSFTDSPVNPSIIKLFQQIGGDRLFLSNGDKRLSDDIEECNIQAEVELYSDPAFCTEVEANQSVMWLHPSVLIRKLHLFSRLFLKEDTTAARVTAPLVGIFFVDDWTPTHWVEAGILFEKLFLTAVSHNLKFKPISNCLRSAKWREHVKQLTHRKAGIPAIGFYCSN